MYLNLKLNLLVFQWHVSHHSFSLALAQLSMNLRPKMETGKWKDYFCFKSIFSTVSEETQLAGRESIYLPKV